jgi:hypothetical protein
MPITPLVSSKSEPRDAGRLGLMLDRSTLLQEFEHLHQGWPWSGLARFGPTAQTEARESTLNSTYSLRTAAE